MDAQTRIEELRRALAQADGGAFLVESRVIRRVIRELQGYARLSTSIPHTESQVVSAADIRALAHPDELGLASFEQLPALCLLIAQPEEGELQHWPLQELMQLTWRRLFHGTIDRHLLQGTRTTLTRAEIQKRIAVIGQVEFDEAHFVLKSELRLVDAESRVAAYCELVAVYLELQRFSPDLLPVWFPSLAERGHLDDVIRRDVDADAVFAATRLYGAPPPELTPRLAKDEARVSSTRSEWMLGIGGTPSDRFYLRQLRRRDRANENGNTVAAAVSAMRAAERATTDDKRASAKEKAQQDIGNLVERLRKALEFPESDVAVWNMALRELLTNATHGFWNADKRLLYDLQKVCLDHERVIYKVDLVKWIVSRGRRPLRRPLASVREVMMAKHLASCASRLVNVRLSGADRGRLDGLLHEAAHLAEVQMRQRMRPALRQTMIEVGLEPASIPEQVAFEKLTEDSLDCIVERGYLTMGYLRDAISRNDLKLPDLKHPSELIRGDYLLRADDRLDLALDGVYRRGEFYLRWLQVISSLFFGTEVGRFATRFLIIPFGGAKMVVEIVRHSMHLIAGHPPATAPVQLNLTQQLTAQMPVFTIGMVLMGLIHVAAFRNRTMRLLKSTWKIGHGLLIDLPLRIIRLPAVQMLWRSRPFVRVRRWFVSPMIVAVVGCRVVPAAIVGEPLNWIWVGSVAFLLSLAVNSRFGRDAEELTSEWLANLWYNLHARVIMAVIEWIIDIFKLALGLVERFLYAVDEWLRFHSGESWLTVVAKAILGVIWSFASFLIRIYVNLLIEPTLHPVKHFPVVTVAHKMFLPLITDVGSFMLKLFTPYLGVWLAGGFTGFNIFFLPGIFGFLVWELKENWRLYSANRQPTLTAIAVGSHGETVPRLMKPGFHSGTLPKLFRRMRRLEQKEASFRRFSLRRSARQYLEHVERDVRRFVDRELIHLLNLCPAWHRSRLNCGRIHAASNSLQIFIECDRLGDEPLLLLFQEQSGWAVANVEQAGWLKFASSEQIRSLEYALEGFYRKAGIDLVREQIEKHLIHQHQYDINADGLAIWPNQLFHREILVDLNRRVMLRPSPAGEAAVHGLQPVLRADVVFADSETTWNAWEDLWRPGSPANPDSLPPACTTRCRHTLLRPTE